MKRKLAIIIAIIVLIAGVVMILYPSVSDYVNSLVQRRIISDYTNVVQELEDTKYDDILEAAEEYNREFAERTAFTLQLDEDARKKYESMLNIPGTSSMGYLEIPTLKISLPIYHGTGDSALQNGIGHMEGSSLPVGGETSHSVLSGHTGLPSAKLFTNIDKLNYGDRFYIHILNEVYAYEVDQKLTVLPHEMDDLKIEEGHDYCTLVTCTPYGVNTHRLLIRGHRVEYTPDGSDGVSDTGYSTDTPYEIELTNPFILAGCIFGIIIIVLLFVFFLTRRRKKNKADKDKTSIKGDSI